MRRCPPRLMQSDPMHYFVDIDPVAFSIGPVAVHWYGIMYLIAFAAFWFLGERRRRLGRLPVGPTAFSDLAFYGMIGVIVGGRVGYMLFYDTVSLIAHPLSLFRIWEGGMSFHGGLLGVLVAVAWFARNRRRAFLQVTDLIAPCVPTGLAAGRIGNFINGELWGRAADPSLPWAMVFPQSGTAVPRHPSQLYQFGLEGLLLFVLLWWYAAKPRAMGQVSAAFLIGYGVFRFIAEYFREPDSFLGLRALGLSQGQWLSVPMVIIGLVMWWWAARRAHV